MAKKILGIVGSYRKGGTIDCVISEILDAARGEGAEVAMIYLLDRHIEFCTNCRRCTQAKGAEPGRCIHVDDMNGIIAAIENADALAFGAPVNFGNVNALTQRFIERLICYSYWPWGQAAPKMRKEWKGNRKAVLVTSSAMPAVAGRLFTGSLKTLKKACGVVGFKTSETLYIGLAAMEEKRALNPRTARRARRAGFHLVR